MEIDRDENPFAPGTGLAPALLAGRETATKILAKAIGRLKGGRSWEEGPLAKPPPTPIRIIGPRGVGKTTLLFWAKREAERRNIRVVNWSRLKKGGEKGTSMADLMFKLAGGEDQLLERIRQVGLSLPGGAGFGVMVDRAERSYEKIMAQILAEEPLLLLLDEVHHYDPGPLATLLQKNQELMAEGLPIAMVLAGTPGLDSHLAKVESTFIDRSKGIYINTLSDVATRKALAEPFKREEVAVTPEALEAMAAQTDNYPYFIQLMGEAVWETMEEAGRRDVDIGLVKRAEEPALKGRKDIYQRAYGRLDRNGLMPHATHVMELLESKGGEMDETEVVDALVEANAGIDRGRAYEISDGLREDGFIWTVDGMTQPGIPSFFSYFKARRKKKQ